jgi:hypothetical protein
MQGMSAYLQQMVERSSATLKGRQGKLASEGLLFLGNPQMVFPRLLFEDPVLEPVDRNVWAAIKLVAADGDSITAFPSYEELMLRCNVGSKATISRSISILRSTRWLTVCKARLRDNHGRVRGNIYALHDEPLQLVETLGLDDRYIDWLEGTAAGKHTRHRRAIAVADRVMVDMQGQLQAGEDITKLEMPIPRRIQAMESVALIAMGKPPVGNFFAVSPASVSVLSTKSYQKTRITHPVQELYLVKNTPPALSTETVLSGLPNKNAEKPPKTGENRGGEYRNCTDDGVSTVSVPRSSKYLKKKEENTTTTNTLVVTGIGASTETVLAWPPHLTANDKGLVRLQLATVPNLHHQAVLDALGVKLAAIASGASRPFTSNILTYTRKLCELAIAGKLNPVPSLVPSKPDDPTAMPQTAEAIERGLKAVGCELSNLSSEVRHLRQLGKAGNYVPEALAAAEERWKEVSQRYAKLKQMQVSQ